MDNKTKNKLINTYNDNIDKENIQEKALKSFRLRDMENFLEQLGEGFYFKKTIGIIVFKIDDKYLIEIFSDDRIRITTYELV